MKHFVIPDCSHADTNELIIPLEQLEKEHILKALKLTGFHQKKAADLLKVDRKVIARRMLKFGIRKEK